MYLSIYNTFEKNALKWISIFTVSITTAIEGFLHAIDDAMFYFIPCLGLILWDVASAIKLNKRMAKRYPKKALKDNTGKFRSKPAMRVISTLTKMFFSIIVASYVDAGHLISDKPIATTTVFLAFVLIQIWSIAENTSSENNKKWAKVVQTFVINKASRHLKIGKEELTAILKHKKHDEKLEITLNSNTTRSGSTRNDTISVSKDTGAGREEPDTRIKSGILRDDIVGDGGEKYPTNSYGE